MRLSKVTAAALTALVLAVTPGVAAAQEFPGDDPTNDRSATENADASTDFTDQPEDSALPDTTTETRFLRLAVDNVAPGTVTTTSDPFVTVRATVTNVGDRRVDDIGVRMQSTDAVERPEELRTSLSLDQQEFANVGEFQTVATSLERGASTQFVISMPLRNVQGPSLGIERPGVYPLLLNVNGTPEYGGTARLDDARFLLPVTGVPRNPTVVDAMAPEAVPIPPNTSTPVATTIMWPFADKPRLAAGIPGSIDERVRLIDDDLAGEMSEGGRLDELLKAAESATAEDLDPQKRLAESMCLAVDPDLLVTVSNMTRGYLIVDDPADPTGPAREGNGADGASAWLGRLEKLAGTMCVTALPFAQVDLDTLGNVGDASLASAALESPADIVDTILGVTSVRGVVWSATGQLGEAGSATLRSVGPSTAMVADTSVAPAASGDVTSVVGGSDVDSDLNTTVFDAAAATALAGVGDAPATPAFTPEDQQYDLADDSRTARLQDALGALAYPALVPSTGSPQSSSNPQSSSTSRALTIAPPQYWTAEGDEPAAVLSTLSSLLRTGLATPRPFAEIAAASPTGLPVETRTVGPTGRDVQLEDRVRAQSKRIDSLRATLVEDPQSVLTPRLYTAPLREDLLRSLGTAQRSANPAEATNTARTRMDSSERGLNSIFQSITVLAPGGIYTLASEESPLLLVARNDLPVGVNVRLKVDAPSEMTIDDVGATALPARGSRTITVPTQVDDSRNLSVDFSLTTLDGQQLGEATAVSVRSNAYGQALAIITACAGVLLLLLAGRRLWHRFKGEPDPADEEYERP
ncbi:glycoprotein [Rhodococcus sp. G-MC3]|uniref:glycoprotein n=1 Tax=Rhodococcus sp. G-MC3 TaxID=3046209 RepID=UPI0024BBE332|nr:glycoprotein [Rhodococcus sp. G-MC3]MDJ0393575.1 glycoprotein [Rhodococcus sp. G-MC3]